MAYLVVFNTLLLLVVAFLDWIYPRINDWAKGVFEDWYLRLSDADYKSIGPYMASLVTVRIDESLGMSRLSLRFFAIALVFSQTIFVLILINISSVWGLTFADGAFDANGLYELIVNRLGHALIPLVLINSVADMVSLYVTRDLLRRASESPTILVFIALMILDVIFAILLAALTLFVFGHFLFATNFADSLAAFALNSSILYTLLFILSIGLFLIFAGAQEKRYRWIFWSVGGYIIFFSIVGAFKIAEAEIYSSLLVFNIDDIAVVLVLAVSATATIPTMLGLFLLVLLFCVNLVISRVHEAAERFALLLAETKRGVLSFAFFVLLIAWDLFAFMYAVSRQAP